MRQAGIDNGETPGTSTAEAVRVKQLEQENGELRRAKRDPEVGIGLLRGGARPPTPLMVDYIDGHKDEFGIEPICTVLQVAPSTYYAAKRRLPRHGRCATRC